MAGVVADSVLVELIAKIDQYERDFKRAGDIAENQLARIRKAAEKPVTLAGPSGSSAAEKEAIRTEGVIQREAAKTQGVRERLDAQAAASAEKSEARRVAAAEKTAAAEIAAAEKSAAAQRAIADKAAIGAASLASKVPSAEQIAQSIAATGTVPRSATANDPKTSGSRSLAAAQTQLMRGTALASGTTAAAESEVNHVLIDRIELQNRLKNATAEETVQIRAQITELQLLETYRRAGLSDEQALIRAEEELATIETQRAVRQAEIAAAQQKQLQGQIQKSGSKVASGIGGLAAGIIGVASIEELSHLNDEYIKFSNSLKIAGVSASEFDAIQDHLLKTATRTGQDIGSLSDTYRSIALASHDLGASQDQIIKVTDAVANSLKITGASGNNARGAILQLGHAFETGKVTAREFNGLALNAYPILQAAAAGSDKYGGSVAKLRQALIEGDLSSKEFFDDILKGSGVLSGRAATATLTTAQGFTALNSALVVYFGTADKANGVSAALGGALQALASNLNIVIPAIAAVATGLLVGYVGATVSAAAATARAAAGFTGAALSLQGIGVAAKSAGSSLLAAFGGPIGIAITAVTVGIAAFVSEQNNLEQAAKNSEEGLASLKEQLGLTQNASGKAATEIRGLGNDAISQLGKINGFSGAVAGLTNNLLLQAAAARKARLELLDKQIDDSKQKQNTYFESTKAGADQAGKQSDAALSRRNFTQFLSKGFQSTGEYAANAFSGGENFANAQKAFENQAKQTIALGRERNRISSLPLGVAEDFAGTGNISSISPEIDKKITQLTAKVAGLQKIAAQQSGKQKEHTEGEITKASQQLDYLKQGIDPSAAAAGSASGGRSGPSADTLARRAAAQQAKAQRHDDQFEEEKVRLNGLLLSAQGKQAKSAEDIAEASINEATSENNKRKQSYQSELNEGKINDAQYKELVAKSDAVQAQSILTATLKKQDDIANQQLQADQDAADLAAKALQTRISLEQSRTRKTQLLNELIDKEAEVTRTRLAQELQKAEPGSPEQKKAEGDLKQLDTDTAAKHALNDREGRSSYQEYRDKYTPTGAGKNTAESLQAVQDQIDSIKVDSLNKIADSLTNAATKALGLKGALGDVVGEIIKIGIQRQIIGPIADALFGKSDGSSSGVLGNLLSSVLGGRASGGDVSAGKIYKINENGPEYFQPAQSGKVIPTGRALPASGGGSITQYISVDGRNSVTPAGFAQDILNRANAHANNVSAKAGQTAYNQSPQRTKKIQQLGS